MDLKVLGSSSAGNAYILDNGTEALLIECGVPFQKVKQAVDFDISRIKGAIVSHEHGDHSGRVKEVLDARIPCYMSAGTAQASGIGRKALVRRMERNKCYHIGGFAIRGFPVEHDAEEPFGFLIRHEETGVVLFATDTYYLKYRFTGLSNILLECNYSLDVLEKNVRAGIVSKPQRDRTIKSHMSYETCKEVLLANDLSAVNNIVLIHLSPNNSNADAFRKGIAELTGKSVHVADRGLAINLDKSPF